MMNVIKTIKSLHFLRHAGYSPKTIYWGYRTYIVLSELYTDNGIERWLTHKNIYLRGKIPIKVLRDERGKDVYDAAIMQRDGVNS